MINLKKAHKADTNVQHMELIMMSLMNRLII